MRISSQVVMLAMLASTFAMSSVSAQAQNVRVRGSIEKVEGNNLTVKSRDGAELKLVLKDEVRIGGVVRASLSDIKPDANVAIAFAAARRRDTGSRRTAHLPGGSALQLFPRR